MRSVPSASVMELLSRERSYQGMKAQPLHSKLIDEQVYCAFVLQLSHPQTEDGLDEKLQQEAHSLGLLPPQLSADIEGMTSSLSATTLASDSNNQASLLSQSTAPTSCSSSEHRPMTQPSTRSVAAGQTSEPPRTLSETQRRRSSGFRSSFRNRMAGFKRKKSPSSPTLRSIRTNSISSPDRDKLSIKSGMKSPGSAKSSKSSWSSPASAVKSSDDSVPPINQEAHTPTTERPELQSLLDSQSEEKGRFLDFQSSTVAELRVQCDAIKHEMSQAQRNLLDEKQAKVGFSLLGRPSISPNNT